MQTVSFESISVTGTAVGFTTETLKPTGDRSMKGVYVTVETAEVRFRLDGTNPTSTVGHLLQVGDILRLDNISDMANARFIRTGATSGLLMVSYLR